MQTLNATVAARLDEVAALLDQQGANPFRVAAYRRGAETLRAHGESVDELLKREGLEGLEKLPGIGESLARSIRTLLQSGSLPILERLRGESAPEKLLITVPGIGPKLAERLHDELGIDSLEDLEVAAFDGRLKNLAGLGEKRLAGIRDVMARRLGRIRLPAPPEAAPPVSELLEVDREYREKAGAGKLRLIAPRRFNPRGEAWLPVLHTRPDEAEYTALFSNTALAHRLGRTRDWVVLYRDGGNGERAYTVVTATQGRLKGLRVVRGREAECFQHYEATGILRGSKAS
jgi:hypothetical protein